MLLGLPGFEVLDAVETDTEVIVSVQSTVAPASRRRATQRHIEACWIIGTAPQVRTIASSHGE